MIIYFKIFWAVKVTILVNVSTVAVKLCWFISTRSSPENSFLRTISCWEIFWFSKSATSIILRSVAIGIAAIIKLNVYTFEFKEPLLLIAYPSLVVKIIMFFAESTKIAKLAWFWGVKSFTLQITF
ncbi:MAG: hypothetical protein ACRDA7_01175 [Metamycoplasmataceae bacterium]